MTMIKTALQIKTIGSILKEKRKEKKLELKQVSDEIKISVNYLQALEDGNYTKFPSEVYLKGFLKNYARFLGVNTDKALALYRRENERKQNDAIINSVSNLKSKNKSFTFTPNKIIAFIAVLAIILILVYLGSYVGKVVKVPELTLSSPITLDSETEGTYKTDANFITISGSADIGSTLTINGQELKLNSFEKFSQDFNLEEGNNEFTITAESQFGRTKTLKLIVSKEESPVISVTPSPTPVQISFTADIVSKDTQVSVTVDGVLKTDRVYKVGSTIEFTAVNSLAITAALPASLSVKINGETVKLTNTTNTWTIVNNAIVLNQ